MSGEQKRRSPRFKVALPVKFADSRGASEHRTVDVSRGGVFIESDAPRSLRQLVRLRLELPLDGSAIEVHGMVVHAKTTEQAAHEGHPPGMGIEFFGFGGEPRQKWEEFLRALQSGSFRAPSEGHIDDSVGRSPAVPARQARQASGAYPVASGPGQSSPPPRSGSFPAASGPGRSAPPPGSSSGAWGSGGPRAGLVCRVFPVPVPAVEQLYEIHDRELVSGAMFLCTRVDVPVGERVVLRVIHPYSQESFDLHGLVHSIHADPTYPGLNLALRPSTVARRDQFRAFIERGLPEEDLAAELLDD